MFRLPDTQLGGLQFWALSLRLADERIHWHLLELKVLDGSCRRNRGCLGGASESIERGDKSLFLGPQREASLVQAIAFKLGPEQIRLGPLPNLVARLGDGLGRLEEHGLVFQKPELAANEQQPEVGALDVCLEA